MSDKKMSVSPVFIQLCEYLSSNLLNVLGNELTMTADVHKDFSKHWKMLEGYAKEELQTLQGEKQENGKVESVLKMYRLTVFLYETLVQSYQQTEITEKSSGGRSRGKRKGAAGQPTAGEVKHFLDMPLYAAYENLPELGRMWNIEEDKLIQLMLETATQAYIERALSNVTNDPGYVAILFDYEVLQIPKSFWKYFKERSAHLRKFDDVVVQMPLEYPWAHYLKLLHEVLLSSGVYDEFEALDIASASELPSSVPDQVQEQSAMSKGKNEKEGRRQVAQKKRHLVQRGRQNDQDDVAGGIKEKRGLQGESQTVNAKEQEESEEYEQEEAKDDEEEEIEYDHEGDRQRVYVLDIPEPVEDLRSSTRKLDQGEQTVVVKGQSTQTPTAIFQYPEDSYEDVTAEQLIGCLSDRQCQAIAHPGLLQKIKDILLQKENERLLQQNADQVIQNLQLATKRAAEKLHDPVDEVLRNVDEIAARREAAKEPQAKRVKYENVVVEIPYHTPYLNHHHHQGSPDVEHSDGRRVSVYDKSNKRGIPGFTPGRPEQPFSALEGVEKTPTADIRNPKRAENYSSHKHPHNNNNNKNYSSPHYSAHPILPASMNNQFSSMSRSANNENSSGSSQRYNAPLPHVGLIGGDMTHHPHFKPRRKKVLWAPEELRLLEEGMQMFGPSWATILNWARNERGGFNPHRISMDLKDKARVERNRLQREGRDPGVFALAGV